MEHIKLYEKFFSNPDSDLLKLFNEKIKIGSIAQYKEYIKTIFPNSKVREIVYHAGRAKKERFGEFKNPRRDSFTKNGFYFSKSKMGAKKYLQHGDELYLVMLNVGSPLIYKGQTIFSKRSPYFSKDFGPDTITDENLERLREDGYDSIITDEGKFSNWVNGQVIIFDPDKIHILGSNRDMELYKRYLENNK